MGCHEVTVIIPVFNTSNEALRRSINSAVYQKGIAEIIVVDDGSEKNYIPFLDSLEKEYFNLVKVFHQQNGGVSSARNAALRMASGDVVAFLDSDDELDRSFLESALGILDEKKADVVLGGISYCYSNGIVREMGNPELGDNIAVFEGDEIEILLGSLFNKNAMLRAGMHPAMYVSNCAALYRRSVLEGIEFRQNLAISEDRLFNYEVFSRCNRIAVSGRSWYRYIQNPHSASQVIRIHAKEELVATALEIEALMGECPSSVRDDLVLGIVECFMQTVEFTVLRPGFKDAFGKSKVDFIRELIRIPVYQRAFDSFDSVNYKHRLLKRLFVSNSPHALSALFSLNKFLYLIKCSM